MSEQDKRDLSASFQKTVIAHLHQKIRKIVANEKIKDVALVGGVSANLAIRDAFGKLSAQHNKNFYTAPLQYCADNAAMIGRYGIDALKADLDIEPSEITVSANRKLKSGMRL